MEKSIKERDQFLLELDYHKNQRIFEWVGYKARYRTIAEALKEKNITIEEESINNIVDQQRQSIIELGLYFEKLKRDSNQEQTVIDAASMLYTVFQKLEQDSYFRGEPHFSTHL